MVGHKIASRLLLEKVVPARQPQLRLVYLHHVFLAVAVVRADPEVHQDASVEQFPDVCHSYLQTGRGGPLVLCDRPAAQPRHHRPQRQVARPHNLAEVHAGPVEMLHLQDGGRLLRSGRLFQQTLENYLQLVRQHLEGGDAAAVRGDDVLPVPGAASVFEEILTGVGGPVHGGQQGGRGLDTLGGEADRPDDGASPGRAALAEEAGMEETEKEDEKEAKE